MAKESGVDEQRARLSRGEQVEGGWCFDPGRDPDVFRCGELENKIASGEASVSWDGKSVADLKTGEVTQAEGYALKAAPVTLAERQASTPGARVEGSSPSTPSS